MADNGDSTGSNVVWAIALVIIVAIIALVAFQGGFLGGGNKKINVDVIAPAR